MYFPDRAVRTPLMNRIFSNRNIKRMFSGNEDFLQHVVYRFEVYGVRTVDYADSCQLSSAR